MNIKVLRDTFTENTTIGTLFIDNAKECYTLEDKDRGLNSKMSAAEIERLKIYGETAIAYGKYEVTITYSNKFGIHYPLVNGTTGYYGIRIHCGTNKNDTLGCLLLGAVKTKDALLNSRIAFYPAFEKMLIHKTNTEIGKKLANLHREAGDAKRSKNDALFKQKSNEFSALYESSKNTNKIFIEYVK